MKKINHFSNHLKMVRNLVLTSAILVAGLFGSSYVLSFFLHSADAQTAAGYNKTVWKVVARDEQPNGIVTLSLKRPAYRAKINGEVGWEESLSFEPGHPNYEFTKSVPVGTMVYVAALPQTGMYNGLMEDFLRIRENH